MNTRRIAALLAALVAIGAPVRVAASDGAVEFESTLALCSASTLGVSRTGTECRASSSSAISAATSDGMADSAGRWSTRLAAGTRAPAGGDSSAASYLRFSTSVTTVDAGYLRVHLDELVASSVATCSTCVNSVFRPTSARMFFVDVNYRDGLGESVSLSAWCSLPDGRSAPSTMVVPDDCSSGDLLVPAATAVNVTLTLQSYASTSLVGASTSNSDSSGHIAAIDVT